MSPAAGRSISLSYNCLTVANLNSRTRRRDRDSVWVKEREREREMFVHHNLLNLSTFKSIFKSYLTAKLKTSEVHGPDFWQDSCGAF